MKWFATRKQRQQMHAPRGSITVRGFQAAKTDRLLAGWSWDGGFSAQEVRGQLSIIRARSREMAKNSPHMKRYLDLISTNVVGEGFTLKSTPHDGIPGQKGFSLDQMAAKFIEYHFWRWCTHRDVDTNQTWCDATGQKTMPEIDKLNAKTWARDGEYFMIPTQSDNPYGISFRLLRPDVCDETYFKEGSAGQNPVYCGREIHRKYGYPVAYYFHTLDPQSGIRGQKGHLVRIPANRVIHGFKQEDEDQPRGIPWGHASLVGLKMLDEFNRAELTAARDEACSIRNYYAPNDDPEGIADLTSEEYSAVASALVADKEPGQSEVLPPGWRSETNTPQHPNREVTAFKATMLKDVASGFGVEYSNFANDWSGVSFSSVRSGTISERDHWISLQQTYISQCKSPVFLMWLKSFLGMAISGGFPVDKFEKFAEHDFRGRRWMWVDPIKDMNAAKLAVDNGWKTDTDVASDLGYDFDDNLEIKKREKESRKAYGIEAPLPMNVHKSIKDDKDNDKDNGESEE